MAAPGAIWERLYAVPAEDRSRDVDGDGFTAAEESALGTNPFDKGSNLRQSFKRDSKGLSLEWPEQAGKRYVLQHSDTLQPDSWIELEKFDAAADGMRSRPAQPGFFRILVEDIDTTGDGLTDWESHLLGFDPRSTHTDRHPMSDNERAQLMLSETNTFSLSAARAEFTRGSQAPALIVIRRELGVGEVAINLHWDGTARAGVDYTGHQSSVSFGFNQRVAYLPLYPLDGDGADATLRVTLTADEHYAIDSDATTEIALHAALPEGRPAPAEASRFLAQASFGPTAALVDEVQQLGYEAWIDAQAARPAGYLSPILEGMATETGSVHSSQKLNAWWTRAMSDSDPLRQRVAFALSQILVVSDAVTDLENTPRGMTDFYDVLLENSLGNFRDLIEAVTYHPSMGIYLSHRGNLPPDPERNRYPDENYAREIMQLFTIGLWMLNPDGSFQFDINGERIPTYTNDDITNLARVFTGMSWGTGDTSAPWDFHWSDDPNDRDARSTQPMKIWEGPYEVWNESTARFETEWYHDPHEKRLLGTVLPANDGSEPAYGEADVDRALDVLFNHPNVGPFIGRLLIQRLVTSNPTADYISRVTDAFEGRGPHNPKGIRGDMLATIKAILLDPEARDMAMREDPQHGKLKEPYLQLVLIARALNASAPSGRYEMYWLDSTFGMQPMRSPSVFNFFSPDYQPEGPIRDAGLVAPEFQITNAVTGITIPNYYRWKLPATLNYADDPNNLVRLNMAEAEAIAMDADALIEYLDQRLTLGLLSPQSHSVIHEALSRPDTARIKATKRAHLALHLLITSPEFAVLR